MRAKKYTCIIIAIIVALIISLAFFGLDFGPFKVKGVNDMRFGIDIRGGVEAVYEPKDVEGVPSADELEAARAVIENRMDAQNILDREVTVDKSTGQILVRFPWKSDETSFNPQTAIAELGETARLTFRDPDGNVVVEGKDVKKSNANIDQQTNKPIVQLEFNAEGAKKFEEATGRLINQQISIFMDETLISSPNVQNKISGGQAQITGMESPEAAKDLADKVNSGALPFSLISKHHSVISPTLGAGALNVMVQAGILAFMLVCLFMIFYYRLPGFVACIGLSLQLACQLLLLSIPQFTLTLPGIAGVILSLGMGVDTNVIIAERIKEELNNGKTLAGAIDLGYHRAYSAIVDGNLTTAIVAVILMIFGSGTMLSFGYTLLTGVILNFVSGITLSKHMTSSLSQYNVFKKPGLYGKRRVASNV